MKLIRFLSVTVLLLSACRSADVVAEVGDRRVITIQDVLERQRVEKRSIDHALESLIAEERLAAMATQRRLHEVPGIRARLRAAERTILAQALLEEEPAPDDKQLRAEYEKSKAVLVRELELAHIFVGIPAPQTPEGTLRAQGRINAAWARILGGESFEDVARSVSEDSATSERGGVLGMVKEGQLDPAVFNAAAALDAGVSSGPIQTAYGFHLLKTTKPVATVRPTFEAARGILERDWRNKRLQDLHTAAEAQITARRIEGALDELKKKER